MFSNSYRSWWASERSVHEQSFKNATADDESFSYMISFVIAASVPMLETLVRNLDEDVKGNSLLREAPVTNDFSESVFAAYDKTVVNAKGQSMKSNSGITMARLTGSLDTEAQINEKATRHVKELVTRKNFAGDLDVEYARKIEELRVFSYFQHPKEDRFEVLKQCRKRFKVKITF